MGYFYLKIFAQEIYSFSVPQQIFDEMIRVDRDYRGLIKMLHVCVCVCYLVLEQAVAGSAADCPLSCWRTETGWSL